MTALVRICRQLTGLHVRPLRVGLAHPRVISSAEVDAFFGAAIDFGAEADEIAFLAGARDLPVVSADGYLNEALVSYWEAALAQRRGGRSPVRAAVENAILPLLPHGSNRAAAAPRLGASAPIDLRDSARSARSRHQPRA